MATNEKTRKGAAENGKDRTGSDAALKRLKVLVEETETLADAFEQIARKQGVGV